MHDVEFEIELQHHGVKGMHWGVRKQRPTGNHRVKATLSKAGSRAMSEVYKVGFKLDRKEIKYAIKRAMNKVNDNTSTLSSLSKESASHSGVLGTNKAAMNAIEKVGIEKHKKARYDMDNKDLRRLRDYTDSARYSRNLNSYLATGEPSNYKGRADALKATLNKGKVSDTTVYRSCNIKFSFDGVAKKLNGMNEQQLAASFDSFSKNFKGKSFKEKRVFSTSTSPNFAIDTWRSINPNAAKTYNTYMILNTKNCPGVLADGRTKSGKSLVNTHANQEGILAPDRIRYDKLAWDKKRKMFAISATAMGEGD